MSLKEHVPWWGKVGMKLLLSRIPVSYRSWQALNIFKHGKMLEPAYALAVFTKHHSVTASSLPKNYTVLELGPGDSLATALIARAYGAGAVYLVDVGPFACRDIDAYGDLFKELKGKNGRPAFSSIEEMLADNQARYLTEGLTSLRSIPDRSVDWVFSHAVLEHVRRRDFVPTLSELHRILKPNGISSHQVDFQDHLGGALNNLRFAPSTWESEWMARSGFYTNRIQYSEMLGYFAQTHFATEPLSVRRWPVLPTKRAHLHRTFRDLPEEDLLVSGCMVCLRRSNKELAQAPDG